MMGDDELGAIEYFVTERCGLVFDLRSRTRLMDAMAGFLAQRDFGDASALLRELGESDFDDPLCLDLMALAHDTETHFFRDPQTFDYLTGGALARLLKHKESTKKISAWCGAAATGQEVWSLAMMLDAELDRTMGWRFEILATDINSEALRYAEAGIYTEEEVRQGLSEEQLATYFEQTDDGYRIVDSLRRSVSFQRLNLATTLGSLPIFDVILLRHCLEVMREDILARLGAQLLHHMHPRAYLLTGPSDPNPAGDEILELVSTPHSAAYQINRAVIPDEIFDRDSVDGQPGSGEGFHWRGSSDSLEYQRLGCRRIEMTQDAFVALLQMVKKTQMFSSVPDKVIGEIGKRFELWEFDSGVPMITQGQRGEAFFLLYEGEASVWARRGILKGVHEVATLSPGEVFGEISIILDAPANATVKGIGNVLVFVISRSVVEYVMAKNPAFTKQLEEMVTLRCMDAAVRQKVESSGLPIGDLLHSFSRLKEMFRGDDDAESQAKPKRRRPKKSSAPRGEDSLDDAHTDLEDDDNEDDEDLLAEQAAEEATEKDFSELVTMARILPLFRGFDLGAHPPKPGQIMLYKVPANFRILREGKRGDAIFMVYEGGLRVVTGGRFFKKKVELAHLGRGSLVGEMSLILRQPCCANVFTRTPSKLFRIDRSLFEEWYYDSRDFQFNVDQVIQERTTNLENVRGKPKPDWED